MEGWPIVRAYDCTVCIKTLVRPKLLKRLLASMSGVGMPVLVADDSPDDQKQENEDVCAKRSRVEYLPLAHDVGLSAGRNAMLDHISTPLFVMLDDDFVFLRGTDLWEMATYVQFGLFDLVGGTVLHHGQEAHYEGFIEIDKRTLKLRPISHPAQGPTACEITYNFLAGNTDICRRVRWDDRLKLCEHQAFFLRCKEAGVRVGYIPHVAIDHKPTSPSAYSPYRKTRSREFFELFKGLYGIDQLSGSLSV